MRRPAPVHRRIHDPGCYGSGGSLCMLLFPTHLTTVLQRWLFWNGGLIPMADRLPLSDFRDQSVTPRPATCQPESGSLLSLIFTEKPRRTASRIHRQSTIGPLLNPLATPPGSSTFCHGFIPACANQPAGVLLRPSWPRGKPAPSSSRTISNEANAEAARWKMPNVLQSCKIRREFSTLAWHYCVPRWDCF